MSRTPKQLVASALVVTALMAMAPPSDPVAVYAVVDRVAFAPDDNNPATIQIWGAFSLSEKKPGDHYRPAVKGYMYYKVDARNAAATRAEWSDLKSVAGTKAVVGFASKWVSIPVGRVRCAADALAAPDTYPTENSVGVVKAARPGNTGWPIAKDLLSAKVPDAPCNKAN